jgi:hypothetical protein
MKLKDIPSDEGVPVADVGNFTFEWDDVTCTEVTVTVTRWYHARRPKHCDHYRSIVRSPSEF